MKLWSSFLCIDCEEVFDVDDFSLTRGYCPKCCSSQVVPLLMWIPSLVRPELKCPTLGFPKLGSLYILLQSIGDDFNRISSELKRDIKEEKM